MDNKILESLKKQVCEARKDLHTKLLKAYDLEPESDQAKILVKGGLCYIIIFGKHVWKEVMEFKDGKLEYRLEPCEDLKSE